MYKILKAETLAAKIHLMVVHAPRVASHCQPGQFIIVKLDEKGERIPSPKVILHAFWHVTVKVLNSYVYIRLMLRREVRSVSFESKRYGSYFFYASNEPKSMLA